MAEVVNDNLNRKEMVSFEQPSPVLSEYMRPMESTGKLLSALVKALGRYPNLRVGQLIYAAMSKYTQIEQKAGYEELQRLSNLLFYISDEELVRALEEFIK